MASGSLPCVRRTAVWPKSSVDPSHLSALTPARSPLSTAGYWSSDGPQRPASCLVSAAFSEFVLIIPWVVGSSPTRPTDEFPGQQRAAWPLILRFGSHAHTVPTVR